MANESIKAAFQRLWEHTINQIEERVKKEEGKGLSTNDFTDEYKNKVDYTTGKIGIQPDWNQNDETALDYVKNRTHWIEKNPEIILFEEYEVPRELSNEQNPPYILSTPFLPEVGQDYVIKINNDKIFYSTAYQEDDRVILPLLADNGFQFGAIEGQYVYYREGYPQPSTIDIIITTPEEKIYKIDEKFLPKQNILNGESSGSVRTVATNANIGVAAFAEGYKTTASGNNSHAEGSLAIASGDSSHAEGSLTTASGEISHAEGFGAEASGYASHAEGHYTNATGDYSHTEGYITTASGESSHAEGYDTVASGIYSHAEGAGTIASDVFSHAEGVETKASGEGSHAEGGGAIASGDYSHAEGGGTIASGDNSHVQGKFNIEDTENKYAHIVGNGEFSEDGGLRSNAHTLDWEGNAWFAGDIYVGGASQDDVNSHKVLTEKELASPKNYFALTDIDNGYTYIVQMKNGNLVSRCGVSSIKVTTMPDKIEYYAGEYFDDPTGMIVTATCEDGSVIEITNYTCSDNQFVIGANTVTISYNEAGNTYTTTITVNAIEFDAATILIDFEYTTNSDGTYTITAWKGTKNGVASTELVIPPYSKIIL